MKNKYGLTRNIPKNIKSALLDEAGYGCVICGCFVIEYEHIEPEFCESKTHDPEKMTILCPTCHSNVTSGVITKKAVFEAKINPYSKRSGYILNNRERCFLPNETIIYISGAKKNFNINEPLFFIERKPLIWFESQVNSNSPIQLCASLYDDKNKPLLFINRNEIRIFVDNIKLDYKRNKSLGTSTIKILRSDIAADEILFQMEYSSEKIAIDQLKMNYANNEFIIMPNEIRMNNGSISSDVSLNGIEMSVGAMYTEKPKKNFTQINSNKLTPIIRISHNSYDRAMGFIYEDKILDSNLNLVGKVVSSEALDLFNTPIGWLQDSYSQVIITTNIGDKLVSLRMPKPKFLVQYEKYSDDGEPIWVPFPSLKKSGQEVFDVSYRLVHAHNLNALVSY